MWSDIIGAQGHDHFGGPLVDLCLSFEVLREPAAPCLDQRLLGLGFMPSTCRSGSSIPSLLERWGVLDGSLGHRRLPHRISRLLVISCRTTRNKHINRNLSE